MQVISTGLPYLIVRVTAHGLERARIAVRNFEDVLAAVGAKFVYVLDPARREGRTWDNAGAVEDVATGSAAGPAAAYLEGLGLADAAPGLTLEQGRFVGGRGCGSPSNAMPPDTSGSAGPSPVARGQLQPPWTSTPAGRFSPDVEARAGPATW